MDKPTVLEAQQWASSCFEGHLKEADPQLAGTLMMDLFGWSRTQMLMRLRDRLNVADWERFQSAVQLISNGQPEQYVVGEAVFYGRTFRVTPAVLIPRPETEELVDWVLSDQTAMTKRLLDVGTGSGVLAISLKLARSAWTVIGTDISAAALDIAKENGRHLEADVNWREGDLFAPIGSERFDIIVSNPPYISETERPLMDESVIDFEPHQALFAAHHGLAIYERIAASLAQHLTPSGLAYFEIGFAQGPDVKRLFQSAMPTASVTVREDMTGHDRMVRVQMAGV